MMRAGVVLAAHLFATAADASWSRGGGPGGVGNWRPAGVKRSGRMAIASNMSGFYRVQGNSGGKLSR